MHLINRQGDNQNQKPKNMILSGFDLRDNRNAFTVKFYDKIKTHFLKRLIQNKSETKLSSKRKRVLLAFLIFQSSNKNHKSNAN